MCGQLSTNGESLVTHKCECVTEFLSLSFEKLSDADVRVLNEGLLEEALLAVKLVDLTLEDVFNDVRWLACCFELLAVDLVFFFND